MNNKPFTWTVAFTVPPRAVAHGYALNDGRAMLMLRADAPEAVGGPVVARVIDAPDSGRVATAQGYGDGHRGRATLVRELCAGSLHRSALWRVCVSAHDMVTATRAGKLDPLKAEELAERLAALMELVAPDTIPQE